MIYMFLSNNLSSGDINSSNLPCYLCFMFVMLSCRQFTAVLWSPARKRADLLALLYVVIYCVLSLPNGVSWVKYGT